MNSYDEQLLYAISKHPALFDPTRHDYKNADAKMQAWEEVKSMLDSPEPVERIRQRWKSIRDSYVKYLNKKDRLSSESKIRPYKYEKNLKFLKPFLIAARVCTQSSFSPDENFQTDLTEQIVSISHLPDDDQSSTSSMSSKKRKRNYEFFENSLSAPLYDDGCKLFQHMDDVDIFFLGLAQTIKKLRPLTMAKLKKQIANIISDAEIKELEEVDQYVVHPD